MRIAVVIPFFQRTPGLLATALRSVFAQRDVDDVRIVVIDDASPIDARDEIASLGSTRFPIDVIAQANAGPAAARNRGLDAVAGDARFVAFLDSDDVWVDTHLAKALRALAAGHDFYFADFFQTGQHVGAFARGGRLDLAAHVAIDPADETFSYAGDMFDQIISGNLIGTSTVVYDAARFAAQRFDERFFSAGEDYLFWIACALDGARFCFSAAIDARYGSGVNVYSGAGWGTDGHMRRIQNEMRYRKRLIDFGLTPPQRALIASRIHQLRTEFVMDLRHRLRHRKSLPIRLLAEQWKLDPRTFLAVAGRRAKRIARDASR